MLRASYSKQTARAAMEHRDSENKSGRYAREVNPPR